MSTTDFRRTPITLDPASIAASVPKVGLHTSLALLREHGACADQYKAVRRALGRGWPDDKPIPLALALDAPGLNMPDDWLWALGAVPAEEAATRDRYARLLACAVAEAVLPIYTLRYPDDDRPRRAIETARRYADGEATAEELTAARDAARDAAGDAAWAAAGAAAGAAAWDAARAAAGAAARDAAWDAAGDAARAAAWAAAWAAAGAAARDAAWDAAGGAITEVLRLTLVLR